MKCPVCAADGAQFKEVDKAIFDAAAKAEGEVEMHLAYDDIPMNWTKDAKEAIRAVPAGFQRRRAKPKLKNQQENLDDHCDARVCWANDSRSRRRGL